jgi:hypothetical protein
MRNIRKTRPIGRRLPSALGFLIFLMAGTPSVQAQQTNGEPGSPSSSTTLDGKQLPPPPSKSGGVIKEAATDSTPWWPAIASGKHMLVFDFKYNGPGPGKGGTGVLSVDGKELARKTIPHTMPLVVTFFETFDVGVDTRTAVDNSYELPFRFTGKIDKLSIKVGPLQLSEEEQHTAAETIQKDSD